MCNDLVINLEVTYEKLFQLSHIFYIICVIITESFDVICMLLDQININKYKICILIFLSRENRLCLEIVIISTGKLTLTSCYQLVNIVYYDDVRWQKL